MENILEKFIIIEIYLEAKGRKKYKLQCLSCGKIKSVRATKYHNNNINICLCEQKENTKSNLKNSNKKLYNVLLSMKQRCFNPNSKNYKEYGERGVKVCSEWMDKKEGFINFYNWAIQNNYKEGLTIDRIDVNGDYEPNNCRWATMKEQSNNRRDNIFIQINSNEILTVSEMCDRLNIKKSTAFNRLKLGWDLYKIFGLENAKILK